ncbi:MAG: TonB C-terminal domain-containing protein, partial [Novosphingobium sp.]|nr:TonB C-terminal domain-containing protein [Novosphingobium sp.]
PAPAAVSINGPAQAGSDAFGLQSGNGGGLGGGGSTGACTGPACGGTGMSEVFYRRYLSAVLQEKVQRDDRVNRLVFSADFAITISPSGRISSVSLLKTSGRDDRDASLKAILLAISNLDPPPSGVRFPQRITVRGRRSL